VQEDGADCLLLGCAGMANIAEYITEHTGAPAIDGVAAAVKAVESLIALGLRTCKLAGYGPGIQRDYGPGTPIGA
jgi:allantoin racemase